MTGCGGSLSAACRAGRSRACSVVTKPEGCAREKRPARPAICRTSDACGAGKWDGARSWLDSRYGSFWGHFAD